MAFRDETVTECDCRSSVLTIRNSKSTVRGDASGASRADVTQCDYRPSVSTVRHSKTPVRRRAGDTSSSAGFTLLSDGQKVDATLIAKLPPDMRSETSI